MAAMFGQLYESCLENITLISLSPNQEGEKRAGNTELVTLGEVFRLSRYVLFYIIRASNTYSKDFLQSIRHLLSIRNTSNQAPSSVSSPAKIKRLFGLKRSSKKKIAAAVHNQLVAVVVDLEEGNNLEFSLCNIAESGFYYLPPQQYTTKSRLLRALSFSGIAPALVVLDATELHITTSHGRKMLLEDPKGSLFPWTDPSPAEAFRGKFVKNVKRSDGTKELEVIDSSSLKAAVKGLYFGAKWCPPCRVITKQLSVAYDKLKEKHPFFEIFFCSSDRNEDSFKEHFASMPWLAFPFDNEKLNLLTRTYDVNDMEEVCSCLTPQAPTFLGGGCLSTS